MPDAEFLHEIISAPDRPGGRNGQRWRGHPFAHGCGRNAHSHPPGTSSSGISIGKTRTSTPPCELNHKGTRKPAHVGTPESVTFLLALTESVIEAQNACPSGWTPGRIRGETSFFGVQRNGHGDSRADAL